MEDGRRCILIIDDDDALLIPTILEQAGYTVLTALSGTEGLRLAHEQRPDLIICDIMMPPPDGFEVREQLNQNPAVKSIPFIFVTALTRQSDRLQGIESGADDYITKPFNRHELLARVKAVLRRSELSRQQGIVEAQTQMEMLRHEVTKNFTHELRTPLSKIMMSLELMLRDKFGDDDQERQNFLGDALDSAQDLQILINDLLFLSLLDQDHVDTFRQRIRLKYNFHEPIAQCLQRWEDKNLEVRVKVEPDVEIYAPRKRFEQAVKHLMDNACKFSPEGGRIAVHLAPNGKGGGVLTIADRGPGIPHDLREKVFERYYQISQGEGRLYGGLGVGLTIARAIVRALGGDVIIADSDFGCRVQMIIAPGELEDRTVDQGSA
jgi:signal transduction histidine kinase